MLRPGIVATPLTALTVTVPERVPAGEPALFPIASVTEALELVTTLPDASSIFAVILPRLAPEAALAGSVPKTTWVAPPAVMLKAELVAEVKPLEVAESV
jgi:hypothetical protein